MLCLSGFPLRFYEGNSNNYGGNQVKKRVSFCFLNIRILVVGKNRYVLCM